MQFDEVLRTFSAFFEREGIRYALAGGLALVAWGHTRPTFDADFVVDGSNGERVRAFAESLGYETTHASDGFSNHRHASKDWGAIDFLYVYGRTAEEVFHDSVRREAIGVDVPVTHPDHLIAMKVHAIRNSAHRVFVDAPDIGYLLTLPNVDQNRARDYFARADLLRIFDALKGDLPRR